MISDKQAATAELKTQAASFPTSPGVYVFRDSHKTVIYVGKARNLKARASSYFSGQKDIKTRFLVEKAADIEAILTSNEYEALVLENNLIKQHNPRYNIDLKDGKSYPVICISNDPFPRVFRTRRIIRDGSEYFGPYPNIKAVDIYIDLVHKLFSLRRCKKLKKREHPCLYYHIGQCSAPCIGNISREEYAESIKKIRRLLVGRNTVFRKELEKQMKAASAELAFERAAELRDALISLESLESGPAVMDFKEEARDYIDYMASGRHIVFAVIQMRGGQIISRDLYMNEYPGDSGEALQEFLLQYYSETGRERPDHIFMPEAADPLISRFFVETPGRSPKISIPEGKRDMAVLAMVRQNADAELKRIIKNEGDLPALEKLQRVLSLPVLPWRIEGFDIAQLHGKHAVASLISFTGGRPERSGYRHYGIRSTEGAVDDYKSIAEAIGRRYQRLLNEEKSLPDLILVDGGKGQVSAAFHVLKALDLHEKISLVGLSKKHEQIWRPHRAEPVQLPEGDPALRVLQYVRNETHRFATSRNQLLRSKDLTLSTLKSIPGLGPAKSGKLLTTCKSLQGIYERSTAEIMKIAGIGEEAAETVREFLGRTLSSRETGKDLREGRQKPL